MKNFFMTWYVPANATIAIAGDFEARPPGAGREVVREVPRAPSRRSSRVAAPTIQTTETAITDGFRQATAAAPARVALARESTSPRAMPTLDIAASALPRTRARPALQGAGL
ncbi:MAG: hypothetical protein IPQ07_36865 [Myxococcales bacterium]|nr:hypothetical protein [Myxococcales bacterium]